MSASADLPKRRRLAVDSQVAARGVRDPAVLEAMASVPREAFVASHLAEFAYEDSPLPIEEGQTISQPYIVALMTEALGLRPDARVLEIGTGSGYAAAVLSRVAREVYTIERHGALAETARARLEELGFENVHVKHGDGTLGWVEHAPYEGIVVAAAGPGVPRALLDQLAVGGRLVIPVGTTPRAQSLLRITRSGEEAFDREDLGGVRFVPLIGEQGWGEDEGAPSERASIRPAERVPRAARGLALPALLRESCEAFDDIESADLSPLLDRIGEARVVLLGEATHGTSEFYRMRARITRELVLRKGFGIVALEADWPDAARLDAHVRGLPLLTGDGAFTRFPTWMWRNREVADFVEWLREHDAGIAEPERRVGVHGLDLYSLHASIDAVLRYLDDVDPEAARVARLRYGCLSPWEQDPAVYGHATLTGAYRSCEPAVVAMLEDLLKQRVGYASRDGERWFDAAQNAKLVANAERYYRVMYQGSVPSWNLRDRHMFDTLSSLLAFRGEGSKAVVWAHDSHVGDARATEMGARGELNIGQLCRERFGDAAYVVGFGTDRGRVAAASDWGGPMEIKRVRPSRPESYERPCHDSGVPAYFLALREPARDAVREELMEPRLERAIGVVYRPETELASHYYQAVLPRQYDEWCWFDESSEVEALALGRRPDPSMPHPFDLG